ncbi:MAG: RlmE family RNA methyltransferase [Deltaproteobacteria bacterium]|jgi:23S rRNA (uridine2552-2'-O)-methyltransferase|nr:RlmE family RNA methyltransferase [Deltaproteobacteria bacterium]
MKQNRWDDHYARRAKKEKWLARSVYKLQEIDNKFKLIRKGNRLLDLGCYPGSWTQYALKKVGNQGEVVGIDLTKPDQLLMDGFRFIQADVMSLEPQWLTREISPRDVVISDLAPSTTGISATDTSRSITLARKALEIACTLLKRNGSFVCKILEGEDIKGFKAEVSGNFRQVRLFRPKATRKRSREVYLVGQSWMDG